MVIGEWCRSASRLYRQALQQESNHESPITHHPVTPLLLFAENVGEKVEVDASGKIKVIEQFASKEDLIKKGYYKDKDWNDYVITARGNHLEHFLNGFKTIELDDLDATGRALEGILALQIHAGPPMLVEFKDILLKPL